MRILVVGQNAKFCETIAKLVRDRSHECDIVYEWLFAHTVAMSKPYSLIICDDPRGGNAIELYNAWHQAMPEGAPSFILLVEADLVGKLGTKAYYVSRSDPGALEGALSVAEGNLFP